MNQVMWKNQRPILAVEFDSGAKLGNCYHSTTYKITSTRPLSVEQITLLRDAGMIGYGQSFSIQGQLVSESFVAVPASMDWKEAARVTPSGKDVINAIVIDTLTGKVIDTPALNEYTGKPVGPIEAPYFQYVVVDLVDSGD